MTGSYRISGQCVLALGLVLTACSSGGGGTGTVGTDTDAATDSDTDGTTSGGSTGTDSGTSGSGTGDQVPELVQDPEIIFHPGQPMVVDVKAILSAPGEIALTHDQDAGVFSREIAAESTPDGYTVTHRVRGLRPAVLHEMTGNIVDAPDSTFALSFTSNDPLPGYVPLLQVEAAGNPIEPLYRLVDLGVPWSPNPSGIAMVDGEGVTRWYLGDVNDITGPAVVFAAAKLRDDGTVLFVRHDGLRIVDELGNSVMDVEANDVGNPAFHHEVLELPNGNFLTLGLAFEDVDYGPPMGVLHVAGDVIVELSPDGEVVWDWNTFDYLDPLRIRAGFDSVGVWDAEAMILAKDWTHGNGLVYDADEDTILVSLRHQDWVLKIDHATSDLVWKLGDEGDFLLDGDPAQDWFYHQHSAQWQADGTLLLYDNGIDNPYIPADAERSRVVRYQLDEQTMEASLVWEDDDQSFISPIAGDADRLPSGNVMVLDSTITDTTLQDAYSRVRVLDENASPMLQWSMTGPPGLFMYRATAHPRLAGQALGE